MEKDLKWIKKHYGEQMMHLCRELFPSILETDGMLASILESHFPYCRHLADDIVREGQMNNFANYINAQVRKEEKEKQEGKKISSKSAVELMKDAGYKLYPECKTEEDVQTFKKYYAKGEELCTFRQNRLNTCRVWFAIKDNIEEIKRENFRVPKRQDEYGTSVISIQFAKNRSRALSIKNRYNHTVENPDNTFNNSLDNIILGLTDAFERDFGARSLYDNDSNFELCNYALAENKMYPMNYEINNVCYCENNIIIDNGIVKKLPLHQMLIDYFIVDFKEKTIKKYMPDKTHIEVNDCFLDTFGKITNIEKDKDIIRVAVEGGKDIEIGVDGKNRITSLNNPNMIECGNNFLHYNKSLESLHVPNLRIVGDDFCQDNKDLSMLNIPKCIKCGDNFLSSNEKLKALDMPMLQECGNSFVFHNNIIDKVELPKLRKCGVFFLYQSAIVNIDLPSLEECSDFFMNDNNLVRHVDMPKLTTAGNYFLVKAKDMEEIDLPSLKRCGDEFLCNNKKLDSVNLPNLESVGDTFLLHNENLKSASFPKLTEMGGAFMSWNKIIENLEIPKAKSVNIGFLRTNQSLRQLVISPEIESSYDLRRVKEIVERNRKDLGLMSISWGHPQSEVPKTASMNIDDSQDDKSCEFINYMTSKFKQILNSNNSSKDDSSDELNM